VSCVDDVLHFFGKLVSASRRASMMCGTFRMSPHVDTASHAYMKSHVQSPMQGAKRQVSKIFIHTPMQKVPCLKFHVQRFVWSHMWGRALGTPHAYLRNGDSAGRGGRGALNTKRGLRVHSLSRHDHCRHDHNSYVGALVVGAAKGETFFNYIEMAREMAHD